MYLLLYVDLAGLIVLSAIVFLLIRQVGMLVVRLGPGGARTSESLSPRKGENISFQLAQAKIFPEGRQSRGNLIVMVSTHCAICHKIRDAAFELARHWNRDADIIVIYDEKGVDEPTDLPSGLFFITGSSLRKTLGISFVPFGISVDAAGTVISRGLVNEISHVESLLEQLRPSPTSVTPEGVAGMAVMPA